MIGISAMQNINTWVFDGEITCGFSAAFLRLSSCAEGDGSPLGC
ncbi:MAG: hypothetical protein RI964_2336 [Pseudomonadota bacterium]